MDYKGYIGKVEIDEEAGILHGEVINIRDVITFEGLTVEDIQKAFRESVDDYLAFCAQRGDEFASARQRSGRYPWTARQNN